MQHILDNAIVAMGFNESQQTPYPELVVGSAYGMPQAICWVYRGDAYLASANGTHEQIVSTFERVPMRALEFEALRREPVSDDWIIDAITARTSAVSPLTRIVATGNKGEASILFESDTTATEEIAGLHAAMVGRSLRRAIDSITSFANGESSGAA